MSVRKLSPSYFRLAPLLLLMLLLGGGFSRHLPHPSYRPALAASSKEAKRLPTVAERHSHLVGCYTWGTGKVHTDALGHLQYYGGPVISHVKVVMVLYGTGSYAPYIANDTAPSMASFYNEVVQSSYIDWLAEYNTPTQTIGRGSYYGKVQITPDPSRNGSTISDAAIQAEIIAQIAAGTLPAPDADTLYMIHFPHGKSVTQGGSYSCQAGGFCAYHGTLVNNGQNVYYGVLPDMQAGSGCDTGCGNSDTLMGNQTSVASHELIEAITDAAVGIAGSIGDPLAWYDSNNGEIGDICNAQQATFVGSDGNTYTVQKGWSNSLGQCIASNPKYPPPAALPPVAKAGQDQSVTATHSGDPSKDTASFTLDGSKSSDPKNETLTHQWSDSSSNVVGTTAQITLSRTAGTYTFTLKVTNTDKLSSSAAVTVTVNPAPNQPPSANPGQDQTVTAAIHSGDPTQNSATFILDGAASSDPDNDPLKYQWKDSTGASLGTSSSVSVTRTTGTYTFTLTVTDPYGASNSKSVKVTVKPAANRAPVANAGPNQTLAIPHDGDPTTNTIAVSLDGSKSFDPEGDKLTYQWTGSGNTVLGSAPTLSLTLTAGTYTFTLIVTDTYGASNSNSVTVTVNPEPNQAPVANAGQNQTIEGQGANTTISLDGSKSFDPDGDKLTYQWSEGSHVLGTSAQLTVGLTYGVHTLTLRVTDTFGASSSASVTVTIADTTPPTVTASADKTSLWPPNGKSVPVTISGTVSDGGSGVNLSSGTYTVQDSEGTVQPSGTFSIKADGTYAFTLSLQASRDGDNQAGRIYTILITAKDKAGNVGRATVTVTVPHDQGH